MIPQITRDNPNNICYYWDYSKMDYFEVCYMFLIFISNVNIVYPVYNTKPGFCIRKINIGV